MAVAVVSSRFQPEACVCIRFRKFGGGGNNLHTVHLTLDQANTQKPPAPATGAVNPQGRFANKVVSIAGATSGIGEGTAYAFAREGAKIFFCGRRENLGRQVEANIKKFGCEATYMRADVRREQEVQAFVNACFRNIVELTLHLIMLELLILRLPDCTIKQLKTSWIVFIRMH